MGALSHIFVDVSGLVVTYLVPVVVWVMLAVGLCQLVRDKIRHVRVMPLWSRRQMRKGLVSRLVEAGRSP
jgi:hypothetical protein